MINGAERLFEMCRAIAADCQQALAQIGALVAPNAFKALANSSVTAASPSTYLKITRH
jgi:hypothetical protein